MMPVLPAPLDPPELTSRLWAGTGGRLAFDVGTNVGQSLAIMRDLFAKVVGFEPCDESREVACRLFPGLEILPVAVSDHDGDLEMAVRAAPIVTGQLVALGMPYRGEDLGPGTADWGDETGSRVISCQTLDTIVGLLGQPDFVKIDTEGHEYQVLLGATTLLARRKARWLVEFHTEDLYESCKALLEDSGHHVETVRHPHYPEGSLMWLQHGWIRAQPG